MTGLLQDLRYALRQLRNNLGFTAIAVLTLALGIGANTAMFTVIDSVLIRPLPYRDAARLVQIGGPTSWLSYLDVRDQAHQIEGVASYTQDVAVVHTSQGGESVFAPKVTTNMLELLGVQPILGRGFVSADGMPGAQPVVLLSSGLWRQQFGADPRIVGQQIRVGNESRAVIGVMPPGFRFPVTAEAESGIWLPFRPVPEMLEQRDFYVLQMIGRLKLGVDRGAAEAELAVIAERIRKAYPDSGKIRWMVQPYQNLITGSVRPVLLALTGALLLVLLIACANVANLQIARYLARQQELAVRVALGASRPRLVRQLISEGATLSLLGSGAGLWLAWSMLQGIQHFPPDLIPRAEEIRLRLAVMTMLAGFAAICTILSSLAPALIAVRNDPQPMLQTGSYAVSPSAARARLSGWLVAGEVALAAVLLVASGLMFRTLYNVEHVHLGFDPIRVVTFSAMPADSAGFTPLRSTFVAEGNPVSIADRVYAPLLERLRRLPGVQGAALASSRPLDAVSFNGSFEVVGRSKDKGSKGKDMETRQTELRVLSAEYARVMGVPVLRGRMLSDDDVASAPFVTVINEAFSKRYFPDQDPLGQQISLGGKETGMLQPYTIVGVLGNALQHDVTETPRPEINLSYRQIPVTSDFDPLILGAATNFVIKTRNNVELTLAIRSVFRELAPGYAVDDLQTMGEVIDSASFNQRLGFCLTGSFAGLAIAMVLAGLYGVLSQLVGQRRHEIGLRMALGATRGSILLMVMRRGAVLIAGGLIVGLLVALATGRLLRGFLYGVQPTDAVTYAVVAVSLLLAGAAAAVIPARRATKVDPMIALRYE